MRKICFDVTDNSCTAVFVSGKMTKNIQFIQAGTTVYSMPVSDKDVADIRRYF